MNPEHDGRPVRLSERLKHLDQTQAQAPQEMAEFDLDAVIRGGERRVRRRNAVGAAAVTASAGLVLAALFTGALSGSLWAEEEPVPEPATTTPAPPAADLVYAQYEDSVTVYDGEEPLARLTLESATVDAQHGGLVEVMVDSDAAFTFDPAAFHWAGNSIDQVPMVVDSEVTVSGFKRLTWAYEGVSEGELAWMLPGVDRPAAVWSVGGEADPAEVELGRVWYLQREDSVTKYEGFDAQVTVSATLAPEPGQARIGISSNVGYELRAEEFVWASGEGSQHAPSLDDWLSMAVPPEGTDAASLTFDNVQPGALLWVPDGKETVGVWQSAPDIPGVSGAPDTSGAQAISEIPRAPVTSDTRAIPDAPSGGAG